MKNIFVSNILKFSLWCMNIIPTDICEVIHASIAIFLAHCDRGHTRQDNNKGDIIKAGKASHRIKS